VKFDEIFILVNQLFNEFKTTTNNCDRQRPKIVIDAYEVGYKLISRGATKHVFAIAKGFAEEDINSVIVCDNKKNRHHSKRASIERRGKRARREIELTEYRIYYSIR